MTTRESLECPAGEEPKRQKKATRATKKLKSVTVELLRNETKKPQQLPDRFVDEFWSLFGDRLELLVRAESAVKIGRTA